MVASIDRQQKPFKEVEVTLPQILKHGTQKITKHKNQYIMISKVEVISLIELFHIFSNDFNILPHFSRYCQSLQTCMSMNKLNPYCAIMLDGGLSLILNRFFATNYVALLWGCQGCVTLSCHKRQNYNQNI